MSNIFLLKSQYRCVDLYLTETQCFETNKHVHDSHSGQSKDGDISYYSRFVLGEE